jgi:hypothetical protein
MTCLIAACAGAPGRDYPKLVPLDTLISDEPLSPSPAPALEARADALRARADALRRVDVVDEGDLTAQ